MKKVIIIFISVGIIILLGVVFIPGLLDEYQSRSAVKNVLDNVIDEDYENAFDSVYYYDVASDLEPIISYEDARKQWIERIKDLKQDGIYLVEYSDLRVKLDDTYPTGTVDLVIMENGEQIIKDNVRLWFGQRDDKWKLGNLDYRFDEVEEGWEVALSGNFN
ncbi:hypothetical protein [Ornithinibacillus sp. 179-J 7C1 HS]|uniref:hypothetical protein n=1 Tax=Ornithinibacillus sp. 179-J 7C1 HS TaxID=3142384 RepID=UPI0039A17A91